MRRIWVAAFVMVVTITVNAEYLYWQVSKDDSSLVDAIAEYNTKWNLTGTENAVAKDHLTGFRFMVKDSDGNETSLWTSDRFDQDIGIDLQSYIGEGYSYYIEVLSEASGIQIPYKEIARSKTPLTYSEAVTQGYVYRGAELSVSSMQIWTGGTYTAAPEPTSGLLVLIGVGLLGLKRKRA